MAMMVRAEGMVWRSFSAAVSGLGMALLYPNLSAAVADIASPAWRGSAIGIYRFWRDLGHRCSWFCARRQPCWTDRGGLLVRSRSHAGFGPRAAHLGRGNPAALNWAAHAARVTSVKEAHRPDRFREGAGLTGRRECEVTSGGKARLGCPAASTKSAPCPLSCRPAPQAKGPHLPRYAGLYRRQPHTLRLAQGRRACRRPDNSASVGACCGAHRVGGRDGGPQQGARQKTAEDARITAQKVRLFLSRPHEDESPTWAAMLGGQPKCRPG